MSDRLILIIPIVLAACLVFAAFQMHAAACLMHVAAVENIRSQQGRDEFRTSYAYCKFISQFSIDPPL